MLFGWEDDPSQAEEVFGVDWAGSFATGISLLGSAIYCVPRSGIERRIIDNNLLYIKC